ncbi:hypothetical protein M0R45_014431 [Rubus argutus]|uniref:Uncharacterized protein n=1 Tax=Rubus argutus TaxID=59490 RepID=A0AAW1XLR6_RUBAR
MVVAVASSSSKRKSLFAFYEAYHSNPVNILIHTMFVWPLLFTAFVLFHVTPSLYNIPSVFNNHGIVFNFGFLLTVIYALTSIFLANGLRFSLSWKLVLAVQFFGWTGRFIYRPWEVLQSAFGYEPYPGFHATVKEKIEADIKEWKVKSQKTTS